MGLEIKVTSGTGTGETKLAAFDRALWEAGIANYNLICLSSVIPPQATISIERPELNTNKIGQRLYVVMAEERVDQIDREAWAGLGWVNTRDQSGGLFVEHHGASKKEVEKLINHSLTDMMRYRDWDFGPIQSEITGIRCEGRPVCALVVAVYQSEVW